MSCHRTIIRLSAVLASLALGWACGGDSATAPEPARPTTVTVSPATHELTALGTTVQLSAEVRDQNTRVMAGATVTWTSSANSVATVDASGLVTAAGNGTATITASVGSASGSAVVTVTQSVASVEVSPPAETIAFGSTLQLTAEAFDENGHAVAGAEFTWESSDAAVATVDASGLVTGVAVGVATITASAGEVAGSAVVTVMQPVASVEVSPSAETIGLGSTLQLTAEGFDENGHAVAGAEFTWESSDAAVATVDASGLVTGVAVGVATITASAGEVAGSAVVTVTQSVASVEVSPPAETIAFGSTLQLTAEAFDENGHAVAGAEFTWESSDAAVATVDASGLVTGVAVGVATITASAGEVAGSAVVTVMQPVASVEVSPSAETIGLGSTLQLTAEGFDENEEAVEGAEFSWESSDAAIATVDGSGLVTGVAEGAATITATAGDARGTAEITVENPDRAALTALYNATDGPNWRNNTNWLSDAPLRLWGGVVVGRDGRVTQLFLEWNGLTGQMPPDLGNLDRLESLFLYSNALTGPIPPELGNLASLRILELDGTDLTGPIPPELGNLTSLQHLSASSAALTGSIPAELGQLTRLEVLELSFNALTGPIPPELGNLTSLRELSLWINNLTGPIPPELGNLASLEGLRLGGNDLTGSIPPELGKLTRLIYLTISGNALTGSIPPELANLPNLEKLSLPGGICVPDDLRAWAVELGVSVFPCSVDDRLLPLALLREDGNGLRLALPDDLQDPAAVTVSDPSVVAVSVADGWLELTPRGRGTAEVEVVPAGGGDPGIAGVEVRAAVGTFGIDIVMDRPAPITYAEALTTGADWWSSVLDGTEWPDRLSTCFNDRATALADELLIHAWVDNYTEHAGYASTCFRSDGNQAALDPGGGAVVAAPQAGNPSLVRHEIGHLLGLILWGPSTGLTTEDRAYFVGPRAVKAFRSLGGDPGLPGVPIDGVHWLWGVVKDFMAGGSSEAAISVAALADAGYTVDMTKVTPLGTDNAQAAIGHAGDVVPPEHPRLPRDESRGAGPPR